MTGSDETTKLAERLSLVVAENVWADREAVEAAESPFGFDIEAYQNAIAKQVEPECLEALNRSYADGYLAGLTDAAVPHHLDRPSVVEQELGPIRSLSPLEGLDVACGLGLIVVVVFTVAGIIPMSKPFAVVALAILAFRLILSPMVRRK